MLGVSCAVSASLVSASHADVASPRPVRRANILLIVADDVGVEMVSAYGEGERPARMPAVDRLARNGVLFRNVWATPTCSPTRATILTGRYGCRTGIGRYLDEDSPVELPQEELILPELLDLFPELGYEHAAVGKWHLGQALDSAVRAGFGQFSGSRSNFRGRQRYDRWLKIDCGEERWCHEYATTDTVDEALEFISSTPEPWFLYLAFNAVHSPYHEPPPRLQAADFEPDTCSRADLTRAMLEALDSELGRLFQGMGDAYERTHIVFTSDNGTPSDVLAPGVIPRRGKATPYESGLCVPLIIGGPAVRQPGREVTALVNSTDLFSTCAELAGLSLPEALPPGLVTDSVSLVPYLASPEAPAQRSIAYSEAFYPNLGSELEMEIRVARNERYKVIHRIKPVDRWHFFDLQRDPDERRNLMGVSWTPEEWRQFQNLAAAMDEIQAR